mmetsp:Transcript_21341/g.49567  ORF Transcript_21341/g.49567 Transcript_21341/m.49567 type:complete len:503 (+) Transcript_21341:52-1560(+)
MERLDHEEGQGSNFLSRTPSSQSDAEMIEAGGLALRISKTFLELWIADLKEAKPSQWTLTFEWPHGGSYNIAGLEAVRSLRKEMKSMLIEQGPGYLELTFKGLPSAALTAFMGGILDACSEVAATAEEDEGHHEAFLDLRLWIEGWEFGEGDPQDEHQAWEVLQSLQTLLRLKRGQFVRLSASRIELPRRQPRGEGRLVLERLAWTMLCELEPDCLGVSGFKALTFENVGSMEAWINQDPRAARGLRSPCQSEEGAAGRLRFGICTPSDAQDLADLVENCLHLDTFRLHLDTVCMAGAPGSQGDEHQLPSQLLRQLSHTLPAIDVKLTLKPALDNSLGPFEQMKSLAELLMVQSWCGGNWSVKELDVHLPSLPAVSSQEHVEPLVRALARSPAETLRLYCEGARSCIHSVILTVLKRSLRLKDLVIEPHMDLSEEVTSRLARNRNLMAAIESLRAGGDSNRPRLWERVMHIGIFAIVQDLHPIDDSIAHIVQAWCLGSFTAA